jgi:ribosome maturation factor RimP
MKKEESIEILERMVRLALEPEPEYFMVELRVKPVHNIQVFLDGDQGITIEKCVRFNRALYKLIEASGLFPEGNFSLEVSSPGLDEPLKLFRQYRKNIGRQVELLLLDGRKIIGRLVETSEDGIIVEEVKPKNGHVSKTAQPGQALNHTYLFNHIKTTKVQSVF